MALVNVCVYCLFLKTIILPWEIALVDPPDTSFLGFYEDRIRQKIQERELQKAYAGKSKDSLDLVNISLCMRDVISIFGPFVKFIVTPKSSGEGQVSSSAVPVKNAFEVLLASQRSLARPSLPPRS